MPPTARKRKSPSLEIQEVRPATSKRRRSSTASTPGRRSARLQQTSQVILDDDEAAPDPSPARPKKLKFDDEGDDELFVTNTLDDDVIDLAGDEPPAAPASAPEAPPKKANRIEFAAFQCAICMDNATNLAVTHCGHMFCSECLQSALNTDATRNKCPICRQKVETKERDAYNSRTKGFWHLELKPMTANKKGKQPSR